MSLARLAVKRLIQRTYPDSDRKRGISWWVRKRRENSCGRATAASKVKASSAQAENNLPMTKIGLAA